jgi:hypothetical protein
VVACVPGKLRYTCARGARMRTWTPFCEHVPECKCLSLICLNNFLTATCARGVTARMCRKHHLGDTYLGLAKAVYIHRIWPCIWWNPCQKYRIFTVLIWFWQTLTKPERTRVYSVCQKQHLTGTRLSASSKQLYVWELSDSNLCARGYCACVCVCAWNNIWLAYIWAQVAITCASAVLAVAASSSEGASKSIVYFVTLHAGGVKDNNYRCHMSIEI